MASAPTAMPPTTAAMTRPTRRGVDDEDEDDDAEGASEGREGARASGMGISWLSSAWVGRLASAEAGEKTALPAGEPSSAMVIERLTSTRIEGSAAKRCPLLFRSCSRS